MQDAYGMNEVGCSEAHELLIKMYDEHDRRGVVVPDHHTGVC